MPTVNRTIRVRRAVAFAMALIVPTILAIATTAYADEGRRRHRAALPGRHERDGAVGFQPARTQYEERRFRRKQATE